MGKNHTSNYNTSAANAVSSPSLSWEARKASTARATRRPSPCSTKSFSACTGHTTHPAVITTYNCKSLQDLSQSLQHLQYDVPLELVRGLGIRMNPTASVRLAVWGHGGFSSGTLGV